MHLINKEIQNYIRCIKTLWNDYYRLLPDGEHDFLDVQQIIWKSLVIKLLKDIFEDIRNGEIVIKPRGTLSAALVGTKLPDGPISWEKSPKGFGGQQLSFEDFFDFRNWEDPRELKYVECWSAFPTREHLLVPTAEVDFYYRPRQ